MVGLQAAANSLVGLAADAPGSGKTTAAEWLACAYGFRVVSIGGAVKREVDAMMRVHGYAYSEAEKERLRPGLAWWTELRLAWEGPGYWLRQVESEMDGPQPVVIPDVRYPEEVDFVERRGGVMVKLVRKAAASVDLPSEQALDGLAFERVVRNHEGDGGKAMIEALEEVLALAGVLGPRRA